MKQEFGKYYLRYAWFPVKLDNGEKIWFKFYYEVHIQLPVVDPVYTISKISQIDFLIESIKGNITIDGMLNAPKPLFPSGARTDEELY